MNFKKHHPLNLICISTFFVFLQFNASNAWAGVPQKTKIFSMEKQYETAVLKVSKYPEITPSLILKLDWIERIAAINHVCNSNGKIESNQNEKKLMVCKKILEFCVLDSALLVRDHALRKINQSNQFTNAEKSQLSTKVVEDERNYRRGKPLWIVPLAKNVGKTL